MGVVPSSISVPLLLAIIILSQYSGSDVSDETMPNKGIWLITKKMSRVNYASISIVAALCQGTHHTPVHINRWLNDTFDSGADTSGRRGVKGLMRSRKRTATGKLLIVSARKICVWELWSTYDHSYLWLCASCADFSVCVQEIMTKGRDCFSTSCTMVRW